MIGGVDLASRLPTSPSAHHATTYPVTCLGHVRVLHILTECTKMYVRKFTHIHAYMHTRIFTHIHANSRISRIFTHIHAYISQYVRKFMHNNITLFDKAKVAVWIKRFQRRLEDLQFGYYTWTRRTCSYTPGTHLKAGQKVL